MFKNKTTLPYALLSLIVVFLLLWQIPWCIAFVNGKASHTLFTLYSSLAGEFITLDNTTSEGLIRYDESGNRYTDAQADSLLPFFYYRQLLTDQRMPDSVCGHAIDVHAMQMATVNWRMSASDVNAIAIPLYPLLESLPKRVDLTMPEDVFRVTEKGLEFIVMATNQVNQPKSELFTKALADKGFTFPAHKVSGNPTTRKEYDEGYLLLDNAGQLFHLKMTAGRPYVKAIPTQAEGADQPLQLRHIFATEFKGRHVRGLLTDEEHHLYALLADYSIRPFEGVRCNPETDRITIFGNMLDWTIRITSEDGDHYYASESLDLSFRLLRQLDRPSEKSSFWGLHFTDYNDSWVLPRF